MSLRTLAVVAFVVAGCQSGASETPAQKTKETAGAPAAPPEASGTGSGSAYGHDVEKLCNALERSGALQQPPEARQIMVAQWLGSNLETTEIHSFLVHIQPMNGPDKAAALDAEAHKVGLPDCPIAREWMK